MPWNGKHLHKSPLPCAFLPGVVTHESSAGAVHKVLGLGVMRIKHITEALEELGIRSRQVSCLDAYTETSRIFGAEFLKESHVIDNDAGKKGGDVPRHRLPL